MTTSHALEDSLAPLFAEAKEKGLWFFCHYQGITFSPKELRANLDKGKFRWGATNWELFDPKTLLKDVEKVKKETEIYNQGILARINDK